MSYIELKNIEKSYGKKIVLKNFNLSVERGEFVGIQGESGKGKSTLLNIIGLLEPCEGEIWLNGHRVSSKDYRKCYDFEKIYNRISVSKFCIN